MYLYLLVLDKPTYATHVEIAKEYPMRDLGLGLGCFEF
jgi:hypothetical protein